MLVKWWRSKNKENKEITTSESPTVSTIELTGDYSENLSLIKSEIGHNSDVNFREVRMGEANHRVAIVFIDGLSDTEMINSHIISDLMRATPQEDLRSYILNKGISICQIKEISELKMLTSGILFGSVGL